MREVQGAGGIALRVILNRVKYSSQKCPLTAHSTQVHSPTVEISSKTWGENLELLTNQSVSEHQKSIHQIDSFITIQINNSSPLRNVSMPP